MSVGMWCWSLPMCEEERRGGLLTMMKGEMFGVWMWETLRLPTELEESSESEGVEAPVGSVPVKWEPVGSQIARLDRVGEFISELIRFMLNKEQSELAEKKWCLWWCTLARFWEYGRNGGNLLTVKEDYEESELSSLAIDVSRVRNVACYLS